MTFEIAKREAVPMLISLVGTSGSGKTYSALMIAAGLAGKSGKVGFIDTEHKRGRTYADDQDVIDAMPNGEYLIEDLTEPFSPDKLIVAIKNAIEEKVDVLIIDSATNFWEGSGGCQDIAENNKLGGMPNWALAKMKHKRLMNVVTQCPMHIIFCVRAREKSKPVKIIDSNGKQKTEIVNEGLQPIQEKNFMYDMMISMMFSEEKPGKPIITKCPKPLLHLFTGEQTLITKRIGEKLREWSNGGASIDMRLVNMRRELKEAASLGTQSLESRHEVLKDCAGDILKLVWTPAFSEEVKALAKDSDNMAGQQAQADEDKLNQN